MARRSAETTIEGDEAITRGTGNVFADLGYPDAEERQTRAADDRERRETASRPEDPDREPLGSPGPENAESLTVVARTAIRLAAPILAVTGFYLVAWGYSPGGGFPGGGFPGGAGGSLGGSSGLGGTGSSGSGVGGSGVGGSGSGQLGTGSGTGGGVVPQPDPTSTT